MTAVKLTPAQARALGIDPPDAVTAASAPARRARRPAGPAHYHTVCHNCGEVFTTQAAETRHLDATRHARYELVLNEEGHER